MKYPRVVTTAEHANADLIPEWDLLRWRVGWRDVGLLIFASGGYIGAVLPGLFVCWRWILGTENYREKWRLGRYVGLRFSVVGFCVGAAVMVNERAVTLVLGFGVFVLKFDFGDLAAIPEWRFDR